MNEIMGSADRIYKTYHPDSFKVIADLVKGGLEAFHSKRIVVPKKLQGFLDQKTVEVKYAELTKHTSSEEGYRKRFFDWFDAFKLMKALHYLRDHFFKSIPVIEATWYVMPGIKGKPLLETLNIYRELDKLKCC